MTLDELRNEVIFEIGTDAYSQYDEERYAIPEVVLHILANACIIAFIKGFVDFETLGKNARAEVEEFLRAFREAPHLVTLNIDQHIDRALATTKSPREESLRDSRQNLTNLLVQYGMDAEIAELHSEAIARSILATIQKERNAAGADA